MKKIRNGFTLIELLVVVLVIGILAAVALPQYQKAVQKSRYASLKPLAKAVKDAQEIYYNEHGSYADTANLSSLDITIPQGASIEASNDANLSYVRASGENLDNRYLLFLNHSNNFAGNVYCEGTTPGDEICAAESGHEEADMACGDYYCFLIAGNSPGTFKTRTRSTEVQAPLNGVFCTAYGIQSCSVYERTGGGTIEVTDHYYNGEAVYQIDEYDENGQFITGGYFLKEDGSCSEGLTCTAPDDSMCKFYGNLDICQ